MMVYASTPRSLSWLIFIVTIINIFISTSYALVARDTVQQPPPLMPFDPYHLNTAGTPLQWALPLPDSQEDLKALYQSHGLVSCYNKGMDAGRGVIIQAINYFCYRLKREARGLSGCPPKDEEGFEQMPTWPLTGFRQRNLNYDHAYMHDRILISLDIKEGCEWLFDENECGRYLRLPVDLCNQNTADHKNGGTAEGRIGYDDKTCLVWRVDPQLGWSEDGWDGCERDDRCHGRLG